MKISTPFPKFVKTKKLETLVNSWFQAIYLAGDERIELPPKVLETPIIPFDQSPICRHKVATIHLYHSTTPMSRNILLCCVLYKHYSSGITIAI